MVPFPTALVHAGEIQERRSTESPAALGQAGTGVAQTGKSQSAPARIEPAALCVSLELAEATRPE